MFHVFPCKVRTKISIYIYIYIHSNCHLTDLTVCELDNWTIIRPSCAAQKPHDALGPWICSLADPGWPFVDAYPQVYEFHMLQGIFTYMTG